jgi:glucose/arabinose dehydrogenase
MSRVRALLPLVLLAFTFAAQPGGSPYVVNDQATAANAPDLQPLSVGSHQLWAPPGYSVSVLASGLKAPRFMAFDAAGNLLLADASAGSIYRYPAPVQPSSSPPPTLLQGLDAPSNVALWGGYLYVGETTAIARYAYDAGSGSVGQREVIVPDLPDGGHSTRTVAFSRDGSMYVAVGSSCNICDESDSRRAAILRFAPDGSAYERFASGLRNPVGLAIQPETGLLWATVNERDNQGNEIPTDLVTVVGAGQNFGWPACQPPFAAPQSTGNDCSGVTPPTIGIQAHSAPLGLAFASSSDLYVAQHGSWNRDPPAEPKLLHIRLDEKGSPVSVADFVKGWQDATGSRWGRPAGITVAPDGSLIVSDDQAGVLYRVSPTS